MITVDLSQHTTSASGMVTLICTVIIVIAFIIIAAAQVSSKAKGLLNQLGVGNRNTGNGHGTPPTVPGEPTSNRLDSTNGYNRLEVPQDTPPTTEPENQFDAEGYDASGYNRDGLDREGYDIDGRRRLFVFGKSIPVSVSVGTFSGNRGQYERDRRDARRYGWRWDERQSRVRIDPFNPQRSYSYTSARQAPVSFVATLIAGVVIVISLIIIFQSGGKTSSRFTTAQITELTTEISDTYGVNLSSKEALALLKGADGKYIPSATATATEVQVSGAGVTAVDSTGTRSTYKLQVTGTDTVDLLEWDATTGAYEPAEIAPLSSSSTR